MMKIADWWDLPVKKNQPHESGTKQQFTTTVPKRGFVAHKDMLYLERDESN